MAPLRKPLIGFFSHSLHFGWKGICVLLSPQNTLCITLLCFLPPPLAGLLSIAFLPSLSLSSSLSPHLMRPHNNTAVVQLFCYLSQTAGSLHSVFLVPFACLLRQGNEYHSERRSTKKKKKKRAFRHLGLHLKAPFCRDR